MLFVVIILALGVCGFNFLIDPFSLWFTDCLEGVNCKKTQAGNKVYLTKSFQWKNHNIESLIIGNSRPELGLDPRNLHFNASKTYNLSLPGASLQSQAHYLNNLLAKKDVKDILVGIDYVDFLIKRGERIKWAEALDADSYLEIDLAGRKNPDYLANFYFSHFYSLISIDAIIASIKTMATQHGAFNHLRQDGFNVADGFIGVVENEGINASFDHSEFLLQQKFEVREHPSYSDPNTFPPFQALKYMLDLVIEADARVIVFMNPYHERYFRVMASNGHIESFFSWKRKLMEFFERNGFLDQVVIYDFSELNEMASEKVPQGKGKYMSWFWEPTHYTRKMGDFMIENMLQGLEKFQLNKMNIDDRIMEQKVSLANAGIN